jgi:MFS family permease
VRTFGEGAQLVGLFIGAVGLGAVVAAVSLARRPSVRGLVKWIGLSSIAAGLGAAGFCFSRSIALSALLMAIAGFGIFMTAASCNTIVQSIVPEDKRGRVMSYYTMFFIGSLPIGHLAAGALAERIGAPFTFLAGGIACALAGGLFVAGLPSLRRHLRPIYVERGIIPSTQVPPQ